MYKLHDHFISDWLEKLKPNKLSTGRQNELKGAAVERPPIRVGSFYFFHSFAPFLWLHHSVVCLTELPYYAG